VSDTIKEQDILRGIMKKFSERRLKENEVIFRQVNRGIQEFIEEENARTDKTIPFYCECSKADCRERIKLTAREYKKLHQKDNQFIILAGHELSKIEKVIERHNGFNVVEKFGPMPDEKSVNVALTNLVTE
jgi:hypothetical protein